MLSAIPTRRREGRDGRVPRRDLPGHAVARDHDADAHRAARALLLTGAGGAEEAQDAQALGRRQGQVPHEGPLQRRDRARHQVARPGLLRAARSPASPGGVSVRDEVRKRHDHRAHAASPTPRGPGASRSSGGSARERPLGSNAGHDGGQGGRRDAQDMDDPRGAGRAARVRARRAGRGDSPSRHRRHRRRVHGASCTIRQALGSRAALPGADTVTIPAGTYTAHAGRAGDRQRRHAAGRGRAHDDDRGQRGRVAGARDRRRRGAHQPVTLRGGTRDRRRRASTAATCATRAATSRSTACASTGGSASAAAASPTATARCRSSNSLIDHNSALEGGGDGGGIINFGGDGGAAAALTIENSTVAFNSARLARRR